MHEKCKKAISKVWENLKVGNKYITPDDIRGVAFTITKLENDKIGISPQSIPIKRNAFVETLYYLLSNGHTENNKCKIESNNIFELAGPLCRASRKENNNMRCINYIIPILKNNGVVEYSGKRPNETWLT